MEKCVWNKLLRKLVNHSIQHTTYFAELDIKKLSVMNDKDNINSNKIKQLCVNSFNFFY